MHWSIRDVEGEYDFDVGRDPPAGHDTDPLDARDGGPVVGDAAIELIGHLARDPRHLSILRAVYLELHPGGGTASDFIIVPRLFDALHMGRLRVHRRASRVLRSDPVVATELAQFEDATALTTLAPEAEAPSQAPLTPAIEHQIAILRRAADSAAVLCEECECE